MRRSTALLYFLFSLCGLSIASYAQETAYENWAEAKEALVKQSILRQWVPMRDGVRLDTNIFLPKSGSAPYPTVLIRSPYPSDDTLDNYAESPYHMALLENGYALVFQNERGRYWSEGESIYLANAGDDGYDTIEWLSKQPWSNGKVGTIGCSSSAENQLALSSAAHPAHAAAIAMAPGAGIGHIGDYTEQGNIYRGGALQLLFAWWFNAEIQYGKRGAAHRPQFPNDLSQEERIKLSKRYKLLPQIAEEDMPDPSTYYQHLPVGDLNKTIGGALTDWDDFVKRMPGDTKWNTTHFGNEGDTFGVPMMWMFSWYDVSVAPNVALYNYARDHTSTERAKDNQVMIVGPLSHCSFGEETENSTIGDRDLGDARYEYGKRIAGWFDYWLKGEKNNTLKQPKVAYYQMGDNEWVESDQFPLKGSKKLNLYLNSEGNANSLYGDGKLTFNKPKVNKPDTFIYNPLRPVPTLGGGACCMGDVKATGSFDQSHLEIRNDILVYTTAPLKEDLVTAGFVNVDLYVSSSAKDTDFTIKLIDVAPDGTGFNLDDTIFRARYREGYDKKVLMKKGEIYKLTIPALITANTFKAGHQVRVEISSSNFPRYDRNLNTGGNNHDETKPIIAHNSIHHSEKYPSRIRFTVR